MPWLSSRAKEVLYPWVLAVLGGIGWHFIDRALKQQPPDNVYAAAVSLGAILVGFLATAQSIVATMLHTNVIKDLREGDFFKDFVRYISSAIYAGMAFVVVSFVLLVGYPELPSAIRHYAECLWIGTCVAALGTFLRATRLLAKVLER